MTSLSQQLQVIQNDRLGLSRVTPSYLYSPREASKLRLEDVFSLASNAFRSLLAKEPRLSKIQESLISDASQRCDRTVLTAQENEKLNGAIEHACRLLGPFVLDRDCAHFLEWLVRRFRLVCEFCVTTGPKCVAECKSITSRRSWPSSCPSTRRRSSRRCCSCFTSSSFT
jgi:hypothetical protein